MGDEAARAWELPEGSPTAPEQPWANPGTQPKKRGLSLGAVGLLWDIRERQDALIAEQRKTNRLLEQIAQQGR